MYNFKFPVPEVKKECDVIVVGGGVAGAAAALAAARAGSSPISKLTGMAGKAAMPPRTIRGSVSLSAGIKEWDICDFPFGEMIIVIQYIIITQNSVDFQYFLKKTSLY